MTFGWVQFRLAAEEVERRLGVTWGRAQKLLLDACDNGELEWEPHEGGPNISYTDFWPWLEAKQSPRKSKRASPKLVLTKEAIKAIWPDGIPNTVTNTQIEREVDGWLEAHFKQKQLRKLVISRGTILRAAGRRKDN